MPNPNAVRGTCITILNLKGGVGKTHTTWLLAAVCQEKGKRVLLIDTDAQGNLTNSFVRDGGSVASVDQLLDPSIDADVHGLIRRTAFPMIDIIPASPTIAAFDLSDQRTWERAELHRSFLDPIKALRAHYDFIVFDCPPRLSLASFAALVASDHVIVPLEAADWGAQGITQVTEAIEYVRDRFNPRLNLLGYLVSRFKPRRSYQVTYLAELRKHFGPRVFDTVILDLAGFERSVTDAIPITQLDPDGRPASVARRLFDETCRRISEAQPRRIRRVPANRRVPAHVAP